jgi:tetratricopeptide (TPR) repeat protein/predicted Ser/Thr protein kinase
MTSQPTQADWDRVEALFPELMGQPPGRRAIWLDRQCGADAALRQELESLLQAATRESTLDRGPRLVASGRAEPSEPADEEAAGSRIGNWRVERLLGRGGMGEVYLASRVEGGFAQQAALKLMRHDAAQHLGRFEAERHILAQLDHPHIAHLLDGGVTPSGRPYMAMEYVPGSNLRDWCTRKRPDLGERLSLFEQICHAVAYAHSHLVIHRDLKPGNVMVSDTGQVKLLDFGIAKLIDHRGGETTTAAPLTPEHAAPEQLEGRPATTAVDVYGLGMLLYELLCGTLPWAGTGSAMVVAVQKVLAEQPLPPSRAAGGAAPPLPPRLLTGDLDAIVTKCLRKTPQHRYPTVQALLDDLRRHREGKPVLARGEAFSYIAGRWLRRHRGSVAAGLLTLAAIFGGLAMALWQAQRAESEAQRAAQVKDFLISVFLQADPSHALGERITARQILDRGVERIERELTNAPLVQADLYEAVAQIERSLGITDRALTHAQSALSLRRQQLGEAHDATRSAIATLARVQHDRGEFAIVTGLLEPMRRQLAGSRDVDLLASVEAQLASAYLQLSRRDEALALQRSAHQRLLARYGADDPRVQQARSGIAAIYAATGDLDAAASEFRALLASHQREHGSRHPATLTARLHLGDVLSSQGRTEAAAAELQRVVDDARATFEPDHLLLGDALIKLGYELRGLRRYAQADAALLEAIAIFEPQHHFNAAAAARYLGFSLREQGRLQEAEARFAEAARLFAEHLGEDAVQHLLALANIAEVRMLRGDYAGAEPMLRDAVMRMSRQLPTDAPELRVPRRRLGETLRELGRIDEAQQLHRLDLALTLKQFPDGAHLAVAASRHQLVLDLLADSGAGQLAEARGHADAAVDFLQSHDPESPYLVGFLIARAEVAERQDDIAQVRVDLERTAATVRTDGSAREQARWTALQGRLPPVTAP